MRDRRTVRGIRRAGVVLALAAGVSGLPALAQQSQQPLDVIYVPTPAAVVKKMLETAKVGPGDVVYDLGSATGGS